MRVEVLPLLEIVTISKMVKLTVDEEADAEEGGMTAVSGVYALDSLGGIWKKNETASELFGGFDFADPQLAKERLESKKRVRAKKKKRVKA